MLLYSKTHKVFLRIIYFSLFLISHTIACMQPTDTSRNLPLSLIISGGIVGGIFGSLFASAMADPLRRKAFVSFVSSLDDRTVQLRPYLRQRLHVYQQVLEAEVQESKRR
jgi:hypothetical protein